MAGIPDGYIERLQAMPDEALKKEWDKSAPPEERFQLIAEMARRFRKPSPQSLYYINKLLAMPEEFMDACNKKEWFRAKRIYDDAITVCRFLEPPQQLQLEFFGYTDDWGREIKGMIPRELVDRVYFECAVKDNLGHECVVYRIPGEIGFYGAKSRPGTRDMAAEENPSYWLQAVGPQ